MIGLTVLFSTYNGAGTLPRMLDALEQLEPPPGGWKLVAVDNSSTDGTERLLRERASRLPITVAGEPRQGKNFALNTGLGFVDGDLVVLTDDDVIPAKDWLVAIRQLADERPDYDIFGGAIYPIWQQAPPDWVLRRVPKGYFAWTDFPEGQISPESIWGPNMAVRRKVFDDHKFRDGIGPNGNARYATGSETEFTVRAERAGHRCWHSEKPVVGHIIRPQQLTPGWLLQRAYNHAMGARQLAQLHGLNGDAGAATLFGYPRYLQRMYAAAAIAVMGSKLFGGFEEQFEAAHALRKLQGDFAARRSLRKAAAAASVR